MISHYAYIMLVLFPHPTIPADVKLLASKDFELREAATERLCSLPGWTGAYFKERAKRTNDLEVRMRCERISEMLAKKWRRERKVAYIQYMREKAKLAIRRMEQNK